MFESKYFAGRGAKSASRTIVDAIQKGALNTHGDVSGGACSSEDLDDSKSVSWEMTSHYIDAEMQPPPKKKGKKAMIPTRFTCCKVEASLQ